MSLSDDIASLIGRSIAGCPPLDDAEAWAKRDAEVAAIRSSEAAAAERARLEMRAKLLEEAGFPKRALDHAIAPQDSAPVVAMRAWSSQQRSILILGGPTGIGKTVASSSYALRSRISQWHFVRAQAFAARSRYERENRESLFAGGLVLDDLGSEFQDQKGSMLVDLEELVDEFYASKRPLVITTNIAAQAMPKRYKSDRLISRLRESARWVELGNAPSLRPAPAAVKSTTR